MCPPVSFEDAKDSLDVLIELGGQISADQTRYLKSRGTRLVSYCCGPEYVQLIEAMIFGRRMCDTLFINQQYDALWVIPQVVETSANFFEILRRRAVCQVPFVWDPICLAERTRDLPYQGEYRPRQGPRRLAIMEPNIDVLKFCLYPLLIAETAYRNQPQDIAYLHVTNAQHLAMNSPEFVGVAQYLDLVRDSRVSFVGRYDTPEFIALHADIVISHQWGLALNYFYFDVCWQGYPLVHNASLCAELGYFYEGNDVFGGASQVREAVRAHDSQWETYRERQRAAIGRYLADSRALVAQYDDLVYALLEDDPGRGVAPV
jgi:hypothetical protein